jgi:membrane fusion protein, heavy metal efflux system
MGRQSWLLLVLFAACAAPACTTSLGTDRVQNPAAQAATPPGTVRLPRASLAYVKLATVGIASGTFEVAAPAHVTFRDGARSRVGVPFSGRVVTVEVKTGDPVRAGDALLTVAAPDAAAARTAKEAARAALDEAQAAVDREHRMQAAEVGIERERLEAEAHLAACRAEAERADATATVIGEGRGADLVVRAPISGMVLDVRTSAGASVEPGGDPLVEIGDPTAVWVVADVADHDLPFVTPGAKASIELDAASAPLTARVVAVGAVVSDALRTAPVRLALDTPPSGLRPGTFGRARIATAAVNGTTLPSEAVLIKGGKDTIVYVAAGDDLFERRVVSVGRPVEGRVRVLSGLVPGDKVVVEGALLLDGSAEQLL